MGYPIKEKQSKFAEVILGEKISSFFCDNGDHKQCYSQWTYPVRDAIAGYITGYQRVWCPCECHKEENHHENRT